MNLSTKGNTEVLQKRLAQAKEEQEKKKQEDLAAYEAEQKKQKEEEKRNQEAEQEKQKEEEEEEEKRNQGADQTKKRKPENTTLNANKSKIPKLEDQASMKNELGSTIKKETGSSSKIKKETTSRKGKKGPRKSSKALIEYDLASLKTLQGIKGCLQSFRRNKTIKSAHHFITINRVSLVLCPYLWVITSQCMHLCFL